MNNVNIKMCVIGGDIRMLITAKELADAGFEVSVFGFDTGVCSCGSAVRCGSIGDAVKGASVVILPVPFSSDGCRINCPFSKTEIRIDEVLNALSPGQLLFAGVCTPSFASKAEEKNITLIDYMKDEELTVRNAVPTAEGAVEIALRELGVTVRGSKTLVIGYGRIGKLTAAAFAALGADVTVCARRGEALAWAEAYGHKSAHTDSICAAAGGKDLIINTVPELILDRNVLCCVEPDALIIDLASMPGGVDDGFAAAKSIKVIHALSLPGKTAPVTAGKNIADAILRIMKRRSVL